MHVAFVVEREAGQAHLCGPVTRLGEPFGKQSVTVSSEGGQLVARSAAELKVDLGPINLFRYKQTCSETWGGAALAMLDCATLKDGKTTKVQGAVKDAAFNVSVGKSAKAYPAAAIPTAWWSRPPVGSYEMINTETGKPLAVQVALIGRETITVNGSNFSHGVVINVSGGGVTVTQVEFVSPTQVKATLNVAQTAAASARDVSATTTDGRKGAVCSKCLTVRHNGTARCAGPSSAVYTFTHRASPDCTHGGGLVRLRTSFPTKRPAERGSVVGCGWGVVRRPLPRRAPDGGGPTSSCVTGRMAIRVACT